MIDDLAIQLACRDRARDAVVATTGSTTLVATATGYTRAAGSFLTDGFAVGLEVTPSGFSDTTPRTITFVDATTMTVNSAVTAQTSGSGRTLTANGLPSRMLYENKQFADASQPGATDTWAEESYSPGGVAKDTLGAFGTLEALGIYRIRWYVPPNIGVHGLRQYAKTMLTQFAATTPMTLASGDRVVVRTRPAPFASEVSLLEGGRATLGVSIPIRTRSTNPR